MEENENNDNEYFAITENGILKLVFKLSFDSNRTFDVDIKVADDADQITSKTFLIPYTFMEDNSSELPFYFDSTTLEIDKNLIFLFRNESTAISFAAFKIVGALFPISIEL